MGGPVTPRIVGAAESPYTRHASPELTTESLLCDAFQRGLASAGLDRSVVDGLGVASFTMAPDHAIDLAWKMGLRPRWLMDDANGGASGIQLLTHAIRAIEAGDATTIVLVAGDRLDNKSFRALVDSYNRATRDHLAPIPTGGPNALFALLTQQQMAAHGLSREDYGWVVIAQREWASRNPGAVYRTHLTLREYLDAPMVAEPLGRLDCPPIVSGANALVVAAEGAGVAIRAVEALHNFDGQEGDGLETGLSTVAERLWAAATVGPEDMSVISVYDDYPAIVLAQLCDLGLVTNADLPAFIHDRLKEQQFPINTSGGQLSAGQAGAAGGMHGLVEAVTQLLGRAGERTVPDARFAVVTGYGMVLYRYGACANAVVLERQ